MSSFPLDNVNQETKLKQQYQRRNQDPIQHLVETYKNSSQLLAVKYFRKKAPPLMPDSVVNTFVRSTKTNKKSTTNIQK